MYPGQASKTKHQLPQQGQNLNPNQFGQDNQSNQQPYGYQQPLFQPPPPQQYPPSPQYQQYTPQQQHYNPQQYQQPQSGYQPHAPVHYQQNPSQPYSHAQPQFQQQFAPQQQQYQPPQAYAQQPPYNMPNYPQAPQHHPHAVPSREQTIQWAAPPAQYANQVMSSCTGNKKALLIGINYTGTKNALRGCINDVQMIKQHLLLNGFRPDIQSTLVLTDDATDAMLRPTRQNILQAMAWLVRGAKSGDSLFLHFSGHGSRVLDKDGDEDDGMDNTICPVDYEANGQIIDDEINAIMVRPLAHGARLTAIFDCCHSGSAMDLPFTYNSDGSIKTSKGALKKLTSAGKSVGMHMLRGNVLGAAMSAAALFGGLGGATKSKAELERTKGNQFADVIMLSGCKDSQTSADSSFSGRASGALTFTFLEAMRQLNGRCSYGQLLTRLRTLLAQGYDQKPQLSSGRYMDMNQPFLI